MDKYPTFMKNIKSKAKKLCKNDRGYWEAEFEDWLMMIYIPEGEFAMGETDFLFRPEHMVYLDGYWISKCQTTFVQYDKYCEDEGKQKPEDEYWGRGDRPVINVDWGDAVSYCSWLSHRTGLDFGLPTEAQWEKAARGTDRRKYPWGDCEPDESLVHSGNDMKKTEPVGLLPVGASPYGCLDMAGNVSEWCHDWYGTQYYKNSPAKNPKGPNSGTERVYRGGSWYYNPLFLSCVFRDHREPSYRRWDVGFRSAMIAGSGSGLDFKDKQ